MKTNNFRSRLLSYAIPAVAFGVSVPFVHAGEGSANASVTSNYIWRGLTQTGKESAVKGVIDYAEDSCFYIGTWA